MSSRLKLYFDTSVISAYFDSNNSDRQITTQNWFVDNLTNYNCFISVTVLEEIDATKNAAKRDLMLEFVEDNKFHVLKITDRVLELSKQYQDESKILAKEINDTIHIACASLNNIDAIVSWNFKHFLNIESIIDVHKINKQNNLNLVEIVTLNSIGVNTNG
ncbi:MAG: PIN domain-containing protein [Ignavibacteria bacterium]|nr:PIN domain-containing protein [Ignavibacteria bacterium]